MVSSDSIIRQPIRIPDFDATNTAEVHSGTDAPLRAGTLRLTGSGTALDVDANANVDGTLTVDGQIISQVTSGPALVILTNKINNLNVTFWMA